MYCDDDIDIPIEHIKSDDELQEEMGYEPVLYRGLNSFMNFALGFTGRIKLALKNLFYLL